MPAVASRVQYYPPLLEGGNQSSNGLATSVGREINKEFFRDLSGSAIIKASKIMLLSCLSVLWLAVVTF